MSDRLQFVVDLQCAGIGLYDKLKFVGHYGTFGGIMRNYTSTAVIILLVSTSAFAQQKQTSKGRPAQKGTSESKSMTDPPIACNLLGLTAAERLRQQELHEQLFSQAESVRELPNGYAVSLPGSKENILAVAEFISLERV